MEDGCDDVGDRFGNVALIYGMWSDRCCKKVGDGC